MASTREIKRWEAVTRSPIYSDFSATLEGLITLRAYKLQAPVTNLFLHQIDINSRAWFSFLMSSRWLGFRLDMESAAILAFVSLFAVWLRNQIDVGLIGLASFHRSRAMFMVDLWTGIRRVWNPTTSCTSLADLVEVENQAVRRNQK